MRTWIRSSAVILVLSGTIALVRCAETVRGVRKVTFARDLRYLDRKTIDTQMEELVRDTVKLDEIFRLESPAQDHQPEVVALLRSMEASAVALEGNGAFSNHTAFDAHIGEFRFDLQRARESASRDPPSYLLASSVSTFCFDCHVRSAHPIAE